MPSPAALTHHAILRLVEPFLRAGRRVDLTASDRGRRRVAFQAVDHAPAADLPALIERLFLDCRERGGYRLTRTLALADGTLATLDLDGVSIAPLLHALESVDASQQFFFGDGYAAARHDRAYVTETALAPRLFPVEATVRLGTRLLHFDFPLAAGLPARLRLATAPNHDALPDDMLAVLGWDWSPLREHDGALRGSVRLRGRDLDGAANRVIRAAGEHLGRVFAEGPRRFRERFAQRRLRVVLRRAIPLVAFAIMVLEVLFADLLRFHLAAPVSTLLVALPLALLALFFFRSQDARLEIPRWPRR